jgi:hypothetical protein
MTLKNILRIALGAMVLGACSRDPLDVNSSNISIKTQYIHLDSILRHSDEKSLLSQHHQLQKDIEEIYSYQLGYCLQIGRISDTAFVRSISQFNGDKAIAAIEKEITKKFGDLQQQKNQLTDGLQHLKYHFPTGKIPEHIVFMNSLFQSNAFCTEKEIGIGLERYLGKDNKVIQMLPSEPFYDWIKAGMNANYLVRDALCAWIMTHYLPEMEGNLAENMIRWGKILYVTEAAFPAMEKNIIIRYSKEDYAWALENQLPFWKFLVAEKMLFKINDLDRANLIGEAPFTVGLSEKSPDRFGQFLGWQMVRNYMENHTINLEKLISLPYNTILQEFQINN